MISGISAAKVIDLVGIHGQSNAQGINGNDVPQPDFPVEYANGLPAHLPRCYWRRWITGIAHWSQRSNDLQVVAPYEEHSAQWTGRITQGCELALAEALLVAGRIPAICKVAEGGTSIDEWDPSGTIYEEMLAVYNGGNSEVKDSLGADCVSIKTQLGEVYGPNIVFRHHLVWWQGETDAETTEAAEAYEEKLSALCAAFFSDFPGTATLPTRIWIVPLHPDCVRSPDNEIGTVNAAYDAVAATDARIVVVANSDLVNPLQSDNAHWQCWAYNEMGRRIAQEILAA